MNTMKQLLLACAAGAFLTANAAHAADMALKAPPPGCPTNDVVRSNNQISLDGAGTDFDYREFVTGFSGTVLDSEKGWVPGVSITGSAMFDTNLFGMNLCHAYTYMRYSWFHGQTNYWSAPVTGVDGANVNEFDFRVGKGFDIAPNTMLTPYIGDGARVWDRYIPEKGIFEGYEEHYTHQYVGAGLLLQYAPSPGLVLSLDGLVGSTYSATISDNNIVVGGVPGLVPTTANLGSELLYMVGGAVDYALTAHWHANAEVDFVSWRYGQSAVFLFATPATFALEPNSQSNILEVRAGFGYAW